MNQTNSLSQFANRRANILETIKASAHKANRDLHQINLVAVCKTQSNETIEAAIEAGQTIFGENRTEEAYAHFGQNRPKNIELRLIGPLQSKKTKDALKIFDTIETLDREKLCAVIQKEAQIIGKMPKLLVQINIGNEPQKSGIAPEYLEQFLEIARQKYGLLVSGLMCIPPHYLPPAPYFSQMQTMAEIHGLNELSMGMSGDYEEAIQYGATHVRIGTALFGNR